MMRVLRRIFVHNAGLKLLAVGISFFLWATYTAEPYAEVAYTVPVDFVNLPAGLALGGEIPTAVHVLVRGRSGLLSRLAPEDLSFHVNLAGAHSGDFHVRLTPEMVGAPYGTEVVRITPLEFRVSLLPSTGPPPPSPE